MPDQPSRRALVLLAIACVVLRAPALLNARWFDPDEAAIALQGKVVAAGGQLYVDIADRKPPIPPLVYAAWFELTDTADARGPRLIASLLLAVAAVVLTREIARTHGRSVGMWAGVLYVASCFAFTPADGAAANFTHFAVPLATLALLACRRCGQHLGWAVAGGVLLGLAILARQSWIFAIPAAILSCWLAGRWRAALVCGAGTAVGVGSAALIVPWDDYWFWNFQSSPGFVFASFDVGRAALSALGATALFTAYHLVLLLGAAGAARSVWHASGSIRRRIPDLDLWAWSATGLLASAAGFRFFGHYFMQVVPPLVVLAAPVVAAWAPHRRRLAGGAIALSLIVVVVSDTMPTVFRDRPDPSPVAAVVRDCTAPSDRVFVWGSFPELAMAVDRPPAGGLVHSDFVTGRSGGRDSATDAATPGAADRMMRDLDNDPPAVLIDTSGVAGLGYEAFPLDRHAPLQDFAAQRYRPVVVDEYVLWWRNDLTCRATAAETGTD